MFCSEHFINAPTQVPPEWIFENYLQLNETLTGQNVKIKSIFNLKDSNPSMHIYYNLQSRQYRYKCFSTGKGGSAIDMLMLLWNVDYAAAALRITADYEKYISSGKTGKRDIKPPSKWEFSNITTRDWNTNDVKYWKPYNIGSRLLEHYNVKPLKSYRMTRIEHDNIQQFTVIGDNIYGYFNSDGKLCKIYQPKNKDRKFFKVQDYIQGIDQMTMKKPYLVICSSLKDGMCLRSLGVQVDIIVPDSENTMLPDQLIGLYKKKYEAIITMFDNDEAGIRNMKKYKEQYDIPFALLKLEKDVSDSVALHGVEKVKNMLVPIIHRQIEYCREKQLEEL